MFFSIFVKVGLFFLLNIWAFGSNSDISDVNEYYETEREIGQLQKQLQNLQHLIKQPWNRPFAPEFIRRINKLESTLSLLREEWSSMLEENLQVEALGLSHIGHYPSTLVYFRDASGFVLSPEDGRRIFFTSDTAFNVWNRRQGGGIEQKTYYYAQKNDYIRKCFNDVDNNKRKNVFYFFPKRRRDVHGHIRRIGFAFVRYTLEKSNDQIRLGINLNFDFTGELEKEKEAFSLLQESRECMKDFFARHGIILDLGINKQNTPDHEEETTSAWIVRMLKNSIDYDQSINLYDFISRANSYNWPTIQSGGRLLTKGNRCSLYVHELSHHFGLNDTYHDEHYPNEELRPVDDIMASGSSSNIERVRLYDEDIQKILRPLCSPSDFIDEILTLWSLKTRFRR